MAVMVKDYRGHGKTILTAQLKMHSYFLSYGILFIKFPVYKQTNKLMAMKALPLPRPGQ